MAAMDEFKEQREKIKTASMKEKTAYYWYYYKWYVFAVIAAIALLGSWIYNVASQKETALFVAMLNSGTVDDENTLEQDFADYANINTEEYDIVFDTTMNISPTATDELSTSSSQRMMVYTSTGELDAIIGGDDIFPAYAYNGMLCDIRTILSEEQQRTYEPYFYYIDGAIVAAIEEAQEKMESADITELPDPAKPELMEDPIPIGIFVSESKTLSDCHVFLGAPALGVPSGTSRQENVAKFVDFLFQ